MRAATVATVEGDQIADVVCRQARITAVTMPGSVALFAIFLHGSYQNALRTRNISAYMSVLGYPMTDIFYLVTWQEDETSVDFFVHPEMIQTATAANRLAVARRVIDQKRIGVLAIPAADPKFRHPAPLTDAQVDELIDRENTNKGKTI